MQLFTNPEINHFLMIVLPLAVHVLSNVLKNQTAKKNTETVVAIPVFGVDAGFSVELQ